MNWTPVQFEHGLLEFIYYSFASMWAQRGLLESIYLFACNVGASLLEVNYMAFLFIRVLRGCNMAVLNSYIIHSRVMWVHTLKGTLSPTPTPL